MKRLTLFLVASLMASTAAAQTPCGGSFSGYVKQLKQDAVAKGHAASTGDQFFSGVRQDPNVIKADRSQGVFRKTFIDFSRSLISSNRMTNGIANGKTYRSVFQAAQNQYGVPPGVLLAFWARETDYGAVQGNFNTLNALVTLSHDCRRPHLFRPQIFAAIELFERGEFDPARTKGAWAGEIGMVQMLPRDILENGVDGDGDGAVQLKTSAPDALMSGGKMLQHLGWRAGEPWLQEVTVPAALDWSLSGVRTKLPAAQWQSLGVRPRNGRLADLPASLILPQGHKGPAFLAYPNFDVYFEWNQSFTYVLTAAYFATRLAGAPVYDAGTPEAGLNANQMKALQQKLQARGHNVGKTDGILGAGTRAAVRAEQKRLGLPADAWPTPALLNRL